MLGRAITVVESAHPADADLAQQIIEACLPHTGNSVRLGITGVPGAGKSTFIEALGSYLISERGERVAVLAVDPSSELSGGSILGDKTRMEKLSADERAFVRPSPSGGALGGVARRTREAMLLCEAAGYRTIFVETMGVGQSETAVASMVDFFLLLLIAGAGDELQGMKRGIVELTDLIAINKADGENRKAAALARQEYENALHLFPAPASGWSPRVVTCSALGGEGLREIWELVLGHRRHFEERGLLQTKRRRQASRWMHEMIEQGLREEFRRHPGVRADLPGLEQAVSEGRLSSFAAARKLLDTYRNQG